jgi:hypothetical protein
MFILWTKLNWLTCKWRYRSEKCAFLDFLLKLPKNISHSVLYIIFVYISHITSLYHTNFLSSSVPVGHIGELAATLTLRSWTNNKLIFGTFSCVKDRMCLDSRLCEEHKWKLSWRENTIFFSSYLFLFIYIFIFFLYLCFFVLHLFFLNLSLFLRLLSCLFFFSFIIV